MEVQSIEHCVRATGDLNKTEILESQFNPSESVSGVQTQKCGYLTTVQDYSYARHSL